jgi:HPt (histidine-containing phosphotransfer) domain-containing protein
MFTDMFLTDYPKRMDLLQSALDAKDAEGIANAAHSLKGAIGIFSSGPAHRAAASLEQCGRKNELTAARQLSGTLATELDRLRHALETFTLGATP